MKLSKGEILGVAKLARLKLNREEIEKFGRELSEVVNYVSELAQVDTKGVEPTNQTTGLTNVFRDDSESFQPLSVEEATSATEKKYNNYFLVPQIVSKEE